MKSMIKQCALLVFVCFAALAVAKPQPPKSPLKILFVGYDSSRPVKEDSAAKSRHEFNDADSVRMPAFVGLLKKYFAEVKTIDCRDWKATDSDPYDVTIFDYTTTALEPSQMLKKANGEDDYIPARYLPDNFSKPVIFIASTAGTMGEKIGLKLDWLCLCLDADAHHVNTHHAIFNGPLEKVKPTFELKETPPGIFHYTTGDTVPKKIPMWTVQTAGYSNTKGFRIGLVSRGNRFTDSPDAEVISSGVCQKDVGAVALGRHGNFFLWGFSASPVEMTDEAQKVFVNAVAYIKQFDKRVPIAHKYNEKMATTDDVKEIIAAATKQKYDDYVEEMKKFNDYNKKEKKRLDDKTAAGETLTPSEKESLNYLGYEQPISSWEDFLKQIMGPFYSKFGTDAVAYQKYMKENFGYLYCDPQAFFTYAIDEDAKKIGIPNHDPRFLDACISMLKRKDQPDLALRMLKKYTAQDFTTYNDWHNWYAKNKSKLFFTEPGGFKFLVNTYN